MLKLETSNDQLLLWLYTLRRPDDSTAIHNAAGTKPNFEITNIDGIDVETCCAWVRMMKICVTIETLNFELIILFR